MSTPEQQLLQLNEKLQACTECPLSQSRKQAVLGTGSPTADILIVGEAPGATEDQIGKPFMGRSGKLLRKMLAKVGIKQKEIFITNVCRCRPPANRDPTPHEVKACSPHLNRTIEIIQPHALLALGRFAAQALSGANVSISLLRTHFGMMYFPYPGAPPEKRIQIFSTYHPAYVLRKPSKLETVLQDFAKVVKYVRETRKETAKDGEGTGGTGADESAN